MPQDSVLRTRVVFPKDGEMMVAIVDTIPDGDDYILVFEWATFVGQEALGEFPKRSARVAKRGFRTAPDSETNYDLEWQTEEDLSAIQFEDVFPSVEEVAENPKNFFLRRPEDSD